MALAEGRSRIPCWPPRRSDFIATLGAACRALYRGAWVCVGAVCFWAALLRDGELGPEGESSALGRCRTLRGGNAYNM
ncbi:hypothetical protein NDU88_008632 [Pleurodeles waltl]|uniref:Uncharacterized protein n=1 Tax=Pleurodeles waltl TaxID=8319 RepID=A0AAV7QQG0_PLEWA|nr:hypothetical protein NDU88_008632 [Pleurodeles waltl]